MENSTLYIIVVGLWLSVGFGIFLKKLDIPVIIGYICTGTVLATFFKIDDFDLLSDIGEFGIVFLMFMIGIEFNFDKLKSIKQEVLVFGLLQVILSALITFLLGYFVLGLSPIFSLVLGMGFSLSSTAIVLKFFEDSKQLNTPMGKSAVGILIFQDIAAIPMLLILTILSSKDSHINMLILKTIISAGIILLILLLPGKKGANLILEHAKDTHLPEIFIGTILVIVFSAAGLSHLFGFSMSLGAFIAGMAISKSRYKINVQEEFAQLKNLFLALFFITIGMQINIKFFIEKFFVVIFLLILVMGFKTFVIYAILRFFRDTKTAIKTALSLAQIGEFSFVIFLNSGSHQLFNLQEKKGIFGFLHEKNILQATHNDIHQLLILMVVFSMLATPFILKYLDSLAQFVLENTHSHTKK
ncbi:cation:proton antiporter [Helicobacter cetorum]|uniref:Glutathione-regulated potassium-efflux system protein n=1 Tax=Helicobacter cetorum (strain ATCC BAA-540 / CCUG 52418 / MIT 99-5656) TaxID=1163745 RepID=I0ETC8_HELCM|nr:cation:proton antiporter [Helicobacter cetorum]AFI06197.1 glutathione-regulated potassium-efflux system protein [Helicobacter cetorum MIT 99-5656]